jgi:hypothetical protein
MTRFVSHVSFAALVLHGAVAAGRDLTSHALLDMYEQSARAIENYDVTLTVTRRFVAKAEVVGTKKVGLRDQPTFQWRSLRPDEQPKVQTHVWRQVRDSRGRRHLESLDTTLMTPASVITFDGEIKRSLIENLRQGYLGPTTTEYTQPDEDYVTFYANLLGEISLAHTLRVRTATHLVDDPTQDQFVAVDSSPERGGVLPSYGFSVQFDTAHGMLPLQIETRREDPGGETLLHTRLRVHRFLRLENGGWAPVEVSVTSFVPSGPIKGQPSQEAVAVVDIGKSSWNKPLPDSLFTIAFPQGISVLDELRRVTFVTGNVQREANLDKLAAQARNVNANRIDVVPSVQTGNWGAWAILALNIAFVAVIAILIWSRRRRARAQS